VLVVGKKKRFVKPPISDRAGSPGHDGVSPASRIAIGRQDAGAPRAQAETQAEGVERDELDYREQGALVTGGSPPCWISTSREGLGGAVGVRAG